MIQSKQLLVLSLVFLPLFSINEITVLSEGSSNPKSGPTGVLRSLFAGLDFLGVRYIYNPSRESDITDTVVVISNMSRLQRAIQLKRAGKIKKLFAGPNLMVRSNEHNHIAASPEIDCYLVNSLWTNVAYKEDEPSLASRIAIWPSGVDTHYWLPQKSFEERLALRHVLVYVKGASQELVREVEQVLQKDGWQTTRITYGNFDHASYKKALEKSAFAVFVGGPESQGLAFVEAWSMDVPTLVYDMRKAFISGKKYSTASYCPYLSLATGIDWRELDEFEGLVKAMPNCLDIFSPRQWVLENMSDEVCSKHLLDIVDSFK